MPCANATTSSLQTCASGPLTPIVVTAGAPTTGIDFALTEGAIAAGRVFDAKTGLAIGSATVTAYTTSGTILSTGTTDVAGRYRLAGLMGGNIVLTATSPRYRGVVHSGLPCAGTSCPVPAGTPIAVTVGQATEVSFALDPLSFIDLQVVFPADAGTGLIGNAFIVDEQANVVVSRPVGTYEEGRVELGPLGNGTYRLYVETDHVFGKVYGGQDCLRRCGPQVATGALIEIAGPGDDRSITLPLKRFPQYTGVVRDAETQAPIAGALVGYSQIERVLTDALGRYRISAPWAPSKLVARHARYVDLSYPGVPCRNEWVPCGGDDFVAVVDGPDLVRDFALTRSAAISGTLRVLGMPVDGHGPSVAALDGNRQQASSIEYFDDGRYEIADLLPGAYHVAAGRYGYYGQMYPAASCPLGTDSYNPSNCAGSVAVPVADGAPTTGIDFDMTPHGRGVRVVATNGLGIPGVAIDAWNGVGQRLQTAVTGRDGRARIAAISGTNAVYLSTDNAAGYVDEVYPDRPCPTGSAYEGQCSPTAGMSVSLPATNATDEIVFVLESAAGVLFANGFE